MAMFWYQKAAAYRTPNLREEPLGQYVKVVRESYVGRALSCLRTPRLKGEMEGVARSPMSLTWSVVEIMVSEGRASSAATACGCVALGWTGGEPGSLG